MHERLDHRKSRHKALLLGFVLVASAVACFGNGPEAGARAHLASVLRDSVGAATDPQVAFIINSQDSRGRNRHLYVQLDTNGFSSMSDSAFALRARDIGALALRHYEKAADLDSISVAALEKLKPGVARIHRQRAFTVADLR